jgi:biopolymer transport protein ExbD
MAGGGALGRPEKVKKGKKSTRKKKKRIGFHLDMTPLVDITFLLLTFFMFTTTMLKPQIMEMRIPPESLAKVEVRESELFTLVITKPEKDPTGKITKEEQYLWYVGSIDPKVNPNNKPATVRLDSIKFIATEENLKPNVKKESRLITLLKVDEEARYDKLVSVLDQLNTAELAISEELVKEKAPNDKGELVPIERKRKFTLAPLTEDDKKLLQSFGGY